MTVVATAGHVDHGKSSLVLALSGTDPDRLAEEQERGLTIDLGFAAAPLPSGRVIEIIDVPGHVRFLKNMLAGVGAVTAAIFVVAADDGWMPQSEEHLRVLEMLGVTNGIVVLTKVDTVDAELGELARLDIEERLAGTFLADAPIIECAAPRGLGIDDVREALDELLDVLPEAVNRGRPRLWVDRSFAPPGAGTVVTGTLTDGELRVDDTVEVGLDGQRCRVRAIQTHGQTVDEIGPGHRVALNLSGISHHDVARGDAVVTPEVWHRTTQIDASLRVLPTLTHRVSRRGAYVAYIGSGEFPLQMRVLGDTAIEPGTDAVVRCHLRGPLPLVIGDRFVLREVGRDETIGGGTVLDVDPVSKASTANPTGKLTDIIAERGSLETATLDRYTGESHTPTIGRWTVHPPVLEALVVSLVADAQDAGSAGIDLAPLSELEREVAHAVADQRIQNDDGLDIADGVLRVADAAANLAQHPLLARLDDEQWATTGVEGDDIAVARSLERAGLAVRADGVWFSSAAIDRAAARLATVLEQHPEGFTVAMARDELGITRKYALPLLGHLDATGRTRRRGDLRVAGPRLLPRID